MFTPTCAVSGCHAAPSPRQGLNLGESTSYALLVGVQSTQNPSFLRVEPGNPDDSWLIRKLEGTANVGARMPATGSPLPQTTIDVIRQWITDGAVDDRAQSTNPIIVTGLSPSPGSNDVAPTSIVASFDRELDVSTVNQNTFLLDRSNGDGVFDDGDDISITAAAITTPATAPRSATFDLTGVNLPDDTYRVRLLGSGVSVIMDIDANALDGDGDGAEGGDYVATFTVTTPSSGATFAEIQTNVFTPTCATSNCHSGGSPQGGLNLEAGQAFNNLVNVSSVNGSCAPLRVNPGNPDNSCLVQRIEGTVAPQMPFGGTPLSQALIDNIREWITNGANP